MRISIHKIRRKIRFRILCSNGNPKIRILKSKSGFPNRKHLLCFKDRTSVKASYCFNSELVSSFVCGVICASAVELPFGRQNEVAKDLATN